MSCALKKILKLFGIFCIFSDLKISYLFLHNIFHSSEAYTVYRGGSVEIFYLCDSYNLYTGICGSLHLCEARLTLSTQGSLTSLHCCIEESANPLNLS